MLGTYWAHQGCLCYCDRIQVILSLGGNGAGEIAQELRVHTALGRLCLVPSTHSRQFVTAYNSSSRISETSGLLRYVHSCAHVPPPLHIRILKSMKKTNFFFFFNTGSKAVWYLSSEILVPGHFTKLLKAEGCANLEMAWKQNQEGAGLSASSSRTKLQWPNFLMVPPFPRSFQAGTKLPTLTHFTCNLQQAFPILLILC